MNAKIPRQAMVVVVVASVCLFSALAAPGTCYADCRRLSRGLANRVAAAVRPHAPEWARPLLSGVQLMRFDRGSLHELTFFLGYGAMTLERLGINGAQPFAATVVIRCRDNQVEHVSEPFAWANTHAALLHLSIANADQAAGYAAEVVSLGSGRRPDSADATRQGAVFNVRVSMAPRQGDPTPGPAQLQIEVDRNANVRRVTP